MRIQRIPGWMAVLCGVAAGASGCTEEAEPTPTLPPETATPTPVETPFPTESGDVDPPNPAPGNTLLMDESGLWLLSPTGGPYDALDSGSSLLYTETLDGAEPPACSLNYSLRGELASAIEAAGCPSCDYVFDVDFTLIEGDPELCRGDDMPIDGAHRILGWSADAEYIYFNYNDTGQWLPWYDAFQDELDPDRLFFTWSLETGVVIDED